MKKKKINNRKPKIMLMIPNFKWVDNDLNALWDLIPWNLCILASTIRDFCEVKIYDSYKLEHNEKQVIKTISDFKPDIIGTSVLLDQYGHAAHKAVKLIKEFDKNIITMIGGVYATTNPERAIKDKNFDYVIQGEGEVVLKELINYIFSDGEIPKKGIAYRKGKEIINLGHSDFITNLDELPLPSYDLIDYLSYANSYGDRKSVDAPAAFPYARIVSSRGCPYGCTFCQVPYIQGSKFRPRSPENVIEEIKWLKDKYGIKAIVFDDDNLFTYKKRAKELFRQMIKNDLALPWLTIATAVFRLDEEMIDLMAESGCQYIDVAIESGNERVIRKIVNKPVVFDSAKRLINYAMSKGIFVAANFIIGFPTETWSEIRETISFAEELNPDYAKIFVALPLQHTKMYDMAIKEKAISEASFDATKIWTSGQMMETRDWKANDLTFLRAYEWDRLNFTKPEKKGKIYKRMGINEEELDNIRRRTLNGAIAKVQESNINLFSKNSKGKAYPNISIKNAGETYPNIDIKNAADNMLV